MQITANTVRRCFTSFIHMQHILIPLLPSTGERGVELFHAPHDHIPLPDVFDHLQYVVIKPVTINEHVNLLYISCSVCTSI